MVRTLGVIGSEPAGRAIAAHAHRSGLTVLTGDPVAEADVVVLAVPSRSVSRVAVLMPDWGGRMVIDATEPPVDDITSLLPGAHVVRAFGAMDPRFLYPDPRHPEGRQVVFFAGDQDSANLTFGAFAARLGFAPVYVGSLRDGGRLLRRDGYLGGVHLLKQE